MASGMTRFVESNALWFASSELPQVVGAGSLASKSGPDSCAANILIKDAHL